MDFVYEDGNGNLRDENGDEAIIIAMEVYEEMYPNKEVTSFGQYMDLKTPEKLQQEKIKKT
ncbi:hypothetical protein EDC94DRAFT_611822 [Helicostylum pulchrum]|nr:hypothetical protein EDC94DRAFT_611822 [Helicostylum pulchrum]